MHILTLKPFAGQVWVGLWCHLGQVHGDQAHQGVPRRNSDGPSRQRRRVILAAKREAEEASSKFLVYIKSWDL